MSKTLINNINNTCTSRDTLYHVGDFVFKQNVQEIEDRINAKVVHIKGNHDREEWPEFMSIRLGDMNCFMIHDKPSTIDGIPDFTDIVICGHYHNQWKYKYYTKPLGKNTVIVVPIINVGVENWNYKPIDKNQILAYAKEVLEIAQAEINEKNPGYRVMGL